MTENDDAAILRRLESSAWGAPEKKSWVYLSVDDDCQRLIDAFNEYQEGFNLVQCDIARMSEVLDQIAQLMDKELHALPDLTIDSILQTRGEQLCVTVSCFGAPNDIQLLDPQTPIRGEFIGLACWPLPTEYAIVVGADDDRMEIVPTLCLMLQADNLAEYDDITTHDNIIAIPLRSGNLGIDQVVNPTG